MLLNCGSQLGLVVCVVELWKSVRAGCLPSAIFLCSARVDCILLTDGRMGA